LQATIIVVGPLFTMWIVPMLIKILNDDLDHDKEQWMINDIISIGMRT